MYWIWLLRRIPFSLSYKWIYFYFSNLLLIISWHFLVVVQHLPNATQHPLVSPWHYIMYPWHPCWPRMSSYYLSFFSLTSPNIFLTLPKVSISSLNIFPMPPQPLKYIGSRTRIPWEILFSFMVQIPNVPKHLPNTTRNPKHSWTSSWHPPLVRKK